MAIQIEKIEKTFLLAIVLTQPKNNRTSAIEAFFINYCSHLIKK